MDLRLVCWKIYFYELFSVLVYGNLIIIICICKFYIWVILYVRCVLIILIFKILECDLINIKFYFNEFLGYESYDKFFSKWCL